MRMRLRLSFLVVAGLAASAAAPFTASGMQRLGRDVIPTFEAVDLRLDANQTSYTGSVRVDLEVKKETTSFGLHAEDMTIGKLTIEGAKGPVPADFKAGGERGLVTITAKQALTPGQYKLSIEFSNEFGTKAVGLYRMSQGEDSYAFTQFEPDDAREAFPCWDEPEFKIPWQLTISVPEKHVAVTNTPVEKESSAGGWKTTVFAKTKPLPTYLIAIATGPLETVPIQGMSVPGGVVVPRGQSALTAEAVKFTPPIMAALERYFGRPYPYEKLDLIAVPEFWPGAMENAGAITFADRILLLDSATANQVQRATMIGVIAHEIAHMWYGDLVTMAWWDDLWLNESFADWMGNKISQEVAPEYRFDLYALGGIHEIMLTDARPSTPAIRAPITGMENMLQEIGVAYNKGRSILLMFENWVGPDAFRQGVRDYINAHEWGNATADDLWSALAKASGKNVGEPMSTFLNQNGVPLVTIVATKSGGFELQQTRFLNYGVKADAHIWQIPVSVKYPVNGELRTQSVLLTQPSMPLTLEATGPVPWIFPNAGQTAYFRWNVPPDMLLAIARDASKMLTVPERVGLLGNVSALLDAGAIHGDEMLKLLPAFASDPDPAVVDAVLTGLATIKGSFVTDELEEPFARYVQSTLRPALERFGMARTEGEPVTVTSLRPQILGWLGREGRDEKVLSFADKLSKSYRDDPTSVDASLVETAVFLSARRGDKALFDEYRKRFETTTKPADRRLYLNALGNFRDPAIMKEAMAYSLTGPLRPNEIGNILQEMHDTPRNEELAFNFLMENYTEISTRIPPMFASFLPFGAGGCSADRLKKAQAFFAEPAHNVPGTDKSLAQVTDQVNDCVALRAREGQRVADALKSGPAASGSGAAPGR